MSGEYTLAAMTSSHKKECLKKGSGSVHIIRIFGLIVFSWRFIDSSSDFDQDSDKLLIMTSW